MTAPVPSQQVATGDFDFLTCEDEYGNRYFSPRYICTRLGADWKVEREKIMSDPILEVSVVEIDIPSADGLESKQIILPAEMFPGWLFTIPVVGDPEGQDRLDTFRIEIFDLLGSGFGKHYGAGILENAGPVLALH